MNSSAHDSIRIGHQMILNRFTTIEKMLEIVETEEMSMSDPSYWEDKNDAHIMELYRTKKKLKALYALCFTKGSETIYHWGAFSSKSDACCIEIAADNLLDKYSKKNGFAARVIEYVKLRDLKTKVIDSNQIPFIKRHPYRNEDEFRIIFQSRRSSKRPTLNIPRAAIKKITINQYLPKKVFDLIKNNIESKWKIKVNRSSVIKNDQWVNHMKKLA